MNIPRSEYPRPQMTREKWLNLNGEWEFEYDFGRSGIERGMLKKDKYDMKIIVPFCPESKLSGVGNTDFLNAVWYRRKLDIPSDWRGERVLLHFEAVDYRAQVWVNDTLIGEHKGGYTPFSFDITDVLADGENIVTLFAEDDTRTGLQPCGKQSRTYHSQGCDYTRVTGIWQTVWLECVPQSYIKSYKVTSDTVNSKIDLSVDCVGASTVVAKAFYDGKLVGENSAKCNGGKVSLPVSLSELHLWQVLDAKLYNLELTFENDRVGGYFGMRDICYADKSIKINGKPVFQRLVLDQGFYPDGIYTAPNDEALIKDIELSIALGFNGARLHEKVFERRFLYHADKMGYLVWGEYGNWGFDHTTEGGTDIYLQEWVEAVERDYNSPALVGWCPFNETWDLKGRKQNDELLRNIYNVTKLLDSTRPVIDTSGAYHVVTDIYDTHFYEQDVEKFRKSLEGMKVGEKIYDHHADRQTYGGQPYFISEYGGIAWNERGLEGWGYGESVKTIDEFVARYAGLADAMLSNPNVCALCYTQLYDIEQEINGLYYYDRTPKFAPEIMEKLRAAMAKRAAIEE